MSSSQTYILSDYRHENKNDMYMKYEKDNLENTIYLLEKKYEIKESEYIIKIQTLNNQIMLIKDSQIKLKNQLLLKDKIIAEFNNLIKDYQIELLNYKQKLEKKNIKIEELKLKIKSFKLNNDLLSNALNSNRTIELDLNYTKIKAEKKMKELNEIANETSAKNCNYNEKYFDSKKFPDFEKIKNELI